MIDKPSDSAPAGEVHTEGTDQIHDDEQMSDCSEIES
jgi:hypothetical protein